MAKKEAKKADKKEKAAALKVSRNTLNQMFAHKDIDIKSADTWPEEKMLGKLKKLPEVVDDETFDEDKGLKKVLADILLAVEKGTDIEIIDDVKDAKKKAEKGAKADKKSAKKSKDEDDEDDEEEDDEDEEGSDDEEESDDEDEESDEEESEDEDDEEEEEEDEKPAKKEKKGKAEKKEKKKGKRGGGGFGDRDAPKDRFGQREGSQGAAINATLTEKPKKIDKIAEECELGKPRIASHLRYLEEKGIVEQTDKGGWKLTEDAAKGKLDVKSAKAKANAKKAKDEEEDDEDDEDDE
jgi:predicted transcriptional regulator